MELRRRLTRWGVAPLAVLLSAVLLGGCDNRATFLDPSGPAAKKESDIFWFILVVATVIFVIVTAVLIYSIIRYRERPDAPEPRQIHGNTQIEIIWTALPSLVLFGVLGFTIWTMANLAEPASASTMHVTARGHQWWWEFNYNDQSPMVVTGDELHVPVGTVVHVDLRSDNVIHSFWVPDLVGKTDVIPGHNNSLWFTADRPGTYRGECAEYCGTQHANMDFIVVADPPAQFAAWLQGQEAAAMAPSTDAQTRGQQNFLHLGCIACHSINGVSARANIGPNLTHFGSRQLIAGGVLSNTDQNLATWLRDTQTVKPGNDMVIPQLQQSQIDDLVAYLESLK